MADTPSTHDVPFVSVNIVSSGHPALDHRLFDKEARTLSACFRKVRIIARHPGPETVEGIEIVPLPGKRSRLDRFLISPWRCLRLCLKHRAQVVHIQDAELLMMVPLLKLFSRSRVVYDVHEDFGNLMLTRDWISRPLRRLVCALVNCAEKVLALSADGIVAVTDSLADKFWNRRRVSAYNLPAAGLLTKAREHSLPVLSRQFDLVHLGTLDGKRLEFLAKIIMALLSKRGSLKILIVGLRDPWLEWGKNNLPPESVEVLGKVPYEDVPKLMGNCRIGINVRPWLEECLKVAVPVKVFEYMACGCSVISSSLPELDTLLDEQTCELLPLIAAEDHEIYVAEIDRILADVPRMERTKTLFERKAREVYSWEAEGKKLLAFYRSVMARYRS